MGPHSVREYPASLRPRYRLASRRDKSRLLDEFCRITGRHRKVAIGLLRYRPKRARRRAGRPRQYVPTLRLALELIWEASDYLRSKRLAPFLPELLEALERHDELRISAEQRTRLLQISPAWIDRLLRPVRRPHRRHGVTTTSPSLAALRAQVPLRTFTSGPTCPRGTCKPICWRIAGRVHTASTSPRSSPSTSPRGGLKCKPSGARATSASAPRSTAFAKRCRCPCAASIPTNGGEFLSQTLIPWCRAEHIHFTRGRPYRKNDQAYVEQKNWAVLRRLIGYDRYCTRAAFLALTAVHELLRPYVNFFQPIRKLVSKERHGARVLKRYDRAQTPYRRLLASGILTPARRDALAAEYHRLNPRQLRADLEARLQALWKLAKRAERSVA